MHKRRKASVPSSGLFFRRFEETEKTYKHHILLLLPVWAAVTALSSAATALPSGHVPQWNGRLRPALVSGGLLILAAGIIHCIGKPKKNSLFAFLHAQRTGLRTAYGRLFYACGRSTAMDGFRFFSLLRHLSAGGALFAALGSAG